MERPPRSGHRGAASRRELVAGRLQAGRPQTPINGTRNHGLAQNRAKTAQKQRLSPIADSLLNVLLGNSSKPLILFAQLLPQFARFLPQNRT